ncbi:MAG: Arc family DNA-binding protein [Verrucomicrobia bacterium]|nr:Arc family DNA-binding protein [Verrucomicrobiota bacterium]
MNVTIKDVPARLHHKLKVRAEANKRSINWEVIDILEKALESAPIDVEMLLAEIDRIRSRIKGPRLTQGRLRQAKSDNRL